MIIPCADLAVSPHIMQHIVRVESSGNQYAIGIVGARLQRQPRNLSEAVSTAKMLEQKGYNFSLGLTQVNRHNLRKYGLRSYEQAFQVCPNLKAGSHILRECYDRSKDWGKSFSCYYSGNFVTGYRHGYVQKVFTSMLGGAPGLRQQNPALIKNTGSAGRPSASNSSASGLQARRASYLPDGGNAANNFAEPGQAEKGNQKNTTKETIKQETNPNTDSAFVF